MARRTIVIHDSSSEGELDLTPEDAYEMVQAWAEHDPKFESLEIDADERILEEIPEEFDVLVGDRTDRKTGDSGTDSVAP